MTLREARKECRRLAIEQNRPMYPMSWSKESGYYPDGPMSTTRYICFVGRDGKFLYASAENERKHKLKGNIRPPER